MVGERFHVRNALSVPSGQSGQIWPSIGQAYAKGGFESCDLTGL
jgi:hypothetical protein